MYSRMAGAGFFSALLGRNRRAASRLPARIAIQAVSIWVTVSRRLTERMELGGGSLDLTRFFQIVQQRPKLAGFQPVQHLNCKTASLPPKSEQRVRQQMQNVLALDMARARAG